MTERLPTGPFIVWEDYGCEGWQPSSYATLKDAVRAAKPDDVITRQVHFDVIDRTPDLPPGAASPTAPTKGTA